MNQLEVYAVRGTSFRGKREVTGWYSEAKAALRSFVKAHPRFNGTIKLEKGRAEKKDGFFISDASTWTTVETFERSKDILDWYLFEGEIK